MDKIYEVLEGKIIDAGELVSMMKAQTDGEGKCVKDFAERIVGLIVSHAHKIPEKVDVFSVDVLNTEAPIMDKLAVLIEKQRVTELEMKNYENSIIGKTVRVAFRNDVETAKIRKVDYKTSKVTVSILDTYDDEFEKDENGFVIADYDFNELLAY